MRTFKPQKYMCAPLSSLLNISSAYSSILSCSTQTQAHTSSSKAVSASSTAQLLQMLICSVVLAAYVHDDSALHYSALYSILIVLLAAICYLMSCLHIYCM
jgi:hypothetical protein